MLLVSLFWKVSVYNLGNSFFFKNLIGPVKIIISKYEVWKTPPIRAHNIKFRRLTLGPETCFCLAHTCFCYSFKNNFIIILIIVNHKFNHNFIMKYWQKVAIIARGPVYHSSTFPQCLHFPNYSTVVLKSRNLYRYKVHILSPHLKPGDRFLETDFKQNDV